MASSETKAITTVYICFMYIECNVKMIFVVSLCTFASVCQEIKSE